MILFTTSTMVGARFWANHPGFYLNCVRKVGPVVRGQRRPARPSDPSRALLTAEAGRMMEGVRR